MRRPNFFIFLSSMIEEIDMGEMKLPNLLILPCFWEDGGGMKRNERGMSGGNKKSPRCVTHGGL